MEKFSKKSFYIFILIIIAIIAYTISAMFLHDPLQVWHKPFFRKDLTYSNNIRESAKAMIRNHNFDSIIIGNSHTENTSCKVAEQIFKDKFINLSITGSTIYEKKIILDYVLKKKKPKKVIYLLDEHYMRLAKEPPGYDSKQYSFLYNNNPFDDFKIYLNDKYLFCTLFFDSSPECIGKIRNMDKPYAWENNKFHSQRFGGFENWIKHQDNHQIKNYFNTISNTPLDINTQSVPPKYIKQMREYFDKYLFSTIEQAPNTDFYIIISPIPHIELARRIRDTNLSYAKYCEALKYLVNQKDLHKNLKIYAFNNNPNFCQIKDFKDGTHYKTWINHYILNSIKNNKYELTTKNINEYLNSVYTLATQFDYEYYYNQIKKITKPAK